MTKSLGTKSLNLSWRMTLAAFTPSEGARALLSAEGGALYDKDVIGF